jgi:hypothetical protein
MNQTQMMLRVLRQFKDETGETDVDMHDLAKFAVNRLGMPLPEPISPLDRLAKKFARAARTEIRHDKETGRPYRANHAYPVTRDGDQLHLWIDIDEAPRHKMFKSLQMRREQMVGDAVQLDLDAEHWSRVNPDEEPIQIALDFTLDVAWRKAAPAEEDRVG